MWLSFVVKGLYAAALYFLAALLLNALLPGSIPATAFTDLGVVIFISLLTLDMVFDFLPVDD